MNNRNPNKENTYSNLAAWCEKYHKYSGIKIHPSSVPVELVLEDVMGYVALLMAHDRTTVALMDSLTKRITDLETLIHELTTQITDRLSTSSREETVKVRGYEVPISDLITKKKG